MYVNYKGVRLVRKLKFFVKLLNRGFTEAKYLLD